MKKFPAIDASFWVLLISATTLGETAGDLLSMTLGLGYAVSSVILLAVFALVLSVELYSRIDHPALYWTVIVLTSTAGTTMSDYVTRSMGLGYGLGSALLIALLTATFVGWRLSARAVSTTQMASRKVEAFYWASILFSSTLGTAFGDFLADDSGLSFLGATCVLAVLLIVISLIAVYTRAPRVLCFWAAIVTTHPIGATMGDTLTKEDGLHLGPPTATVLLVLVFVCVVGLNRVLRLGRS